METKVKIFCNSEEICSLLKKVLNKHKISTECEKYPVISLSKTVDEIISDCKINSDIVVLDPGLDMDFKMEMIQKLEKSIIICLPSLEENDIEGVKANVYKISEPFRLSEFEDVLMKLINDKKATDV